MSTEVTDTLKSGENEKKEKNGEEEESLSRKEKLKKEVYVLRKLKKYLKKKRKKSKSSTLVEKDNDDKIPDPSLETEKNTSVDQTDVKSAPPLMDDPVESPDVANTSSHLTVPSEVRVESFQNTTKKLQIKKFRKDEESFAKIKKTYRTHNLLEKNKKQLKSGKEKKSELASSNNENVDDSSFVISRPTEPTTATSDLETQELPCLSAADKEKEAATIEALQEEVKKLREHISMMKETEKLKDPVPIPQSAPAPIEEGSPIEMLRDDNDESVSLLMSMSIPEKNNDDHMDALEKEYRFLRESMEKNEETTQTINGIYEHLVKPLEEQVKSMTVTIENLNEELSVTQSSLRVHQQPLSPKFSDVSDTVRSFSSQKKPKKTSKWRTARHAINVVTPDRLNLSYDDSSASGTSTLSSFTGNMSYVVSGTSLNKSDITFAMTSKNLKIVNLDFLTNRALQLYFGQSVHDGDDFLSGDFLKTTRLSEYGSPKLGYWYATLKISLVRDQTESGAEPGRVQKRRWDPSSASNSSDKTSKSKSLIAAGAGNMNANGNGKGRFLFPCGLVGRRMGRDVYQTEEHARDALLFYILQDVDPSGRWLDDIMYDDEESCLLKKDSATRNVRWCALLRKGTNIFLIDVSDSRRRHKPVLICDRTLRMDDEEEEEHEHDELDLLSEA